MTEESRLDRWFKIRRSERRLAGLVAIVFAGTQSTHALSVNTADTLFFSRFGVDSLPLMFIALGFATSIALFGYTWALGSLPRKVFYPGLLIAGGLVMIVLRTLILLDARWVYGVLWVTSNMLVLVTLTFMWNVAGDVVDTRSGKRLFPIFASAGVLGGLLGNLATGPLAAAMGAPNLLIVIALLFLMTAYSVRLIAVGLEVTPGKSSPLAEMRRSLALGMSSPLLRLVGVGMILGAALFSLAVFPFSVEVAAAFDTESEIASYLGLFAAAATAATFVVSLFFASRLFARVGVVVAWFMVSVVYVAGFALWLVSLTLVTASVFRFAQWVAVNAIGGTARTAVFNVLGSEDRASVIASFAAVPAQIGVIAAGVLLWISMRIGPQAGIAIGLVLALSLAGVVWRMRRLYSGALVSALQTGHVAMFAGVTPRAMGGGVTAEAVAAATAGLEDPSARVRRLAVTMLGRMGASAATAKVHSMLQDVDLDVRMAALDSLGRLAKVSTDVAPVASSDEVLGVLFPQAGFAGGFDGAPMSSRATAIEWLIAAGEYDMATEALAALTQSTDPEARRVAWQAVSSARWAPDPQQAADALRNDPSDTVRIAAAAATAATVGTSGELSEALSDPVPGVRVAAAKAWAEAGGGLEEPLAILNGGPPWAWEAAIIALSERAREVRDRVYLWAEPRVAELTHLSGQVATMSDSLGDRTAMPAAAYLHWLLEQRFLASRRVAVRVLGLLEDRGTVELVIAGLRSTDTDARAQALEAAETIGGALGRITVPLLEEATSPNYSPNEVLESLSRDDDRWVRILALRCVMEFAAREWAEIIRPATEDDDADVRSTAQAIAARMENDLSESLETTGLMDRMLLLRSIRLFDSLLPVDLERLAMAASEKRFAADEIVFEQGDEGGEMLIIIEGEIEYRADDARVIARVGPGQHLGELTVLSGRPRPAGAVAVSTVSALSIDSVSVENLILERPDVARQMLSSLAEQFSDAIGAAATYELPEQEAGRP